MSKAILATLILGSVFMFGCTSDAIQVVVPEKPRAEQTTGSSFNDTTYVWEDFIFTTNRVNKVK